MPIVIKDHSIAIGRHLVPFENVIQYRVNSVNRTVRVWFTKAMERNKPTLVDFVFKTSDKIDVFINDLFLKTKILPSSSFIKSKSMYVISENEAFKYSGLNEWENLSLLNLDQTKIEKLIYRFIRMGQIYSRLKPVYQTVIAMYIKLEQEKAWTGYPMELFLNALEIAKQEPLLPEESCIS